MSSLPLDLEQRIAARELVSTGAARQLRIASGLSLTEIALALGTTPGAVSRWERSERRPSSAAGVRYLDLLDALARRRP